MKFYKIVDNNCIVAVGVDTGGTEITEPEYNTILSIIHDKPTPPEGYDYHLSTDLIWQLYQLAALGDTDPELTGEEALDIILGGSTNA